MKSGFGKRPTTNQEGLGFWIAAFCIPLIFLALSYILIQSLGLSDLVKGILLELLVGKSGIFLLSVAILYAIHSFLSQDIRAAAGGAFLAIGILSLRLGISAYITGDPLLAFNSSLVEKIQEIDYAKLQKEFSIPSTLRPPVPSSAQAMVPSAAEFLKGAPPTEAETENQVNDTSYSYLLAKRFIESGLFPKADDIRVERLVNYFNYSYTADASQNFSVHIEGAPSPFHPKQFLLQIGLKAKELAALIPAGWHLVFILDLSSLKLNPKSLKLLKQTLQAFTEQMQDNDSIALLGYEDGYGCLLPATPGSERSTILQAITHLEQSLSLETSFDAEVILGEAWQNTANKDSARVLFVSDSDINYKLSRFINSPDPFEEEKYPGLSVFMLGERGRFRIDTITDAKKNLIINLLQKKQTVAKEITVQFDFSPTYVDSHTIVGYEKAVKVDKKTGQKQVSLNLLESGQEVTLLDHLTLTTDPFSTTSAINLGILKVTASLQDQGTASEFSYPILSSMLHKTIDSASNDFRFATAVAGYGALLRQSRDKGDISWILVKRLAYGSIGEDPLGTRKEFLKLVDTAAELLSEPVDGPPK